MSKAAIAKEKINELEDIAMEPKQNVTQRGERLKTINSIWVLWDNFKEPNIRVIRVPSLNKLGIERNSLNLIKVISEECIANLVLMVKDSKIRNKTWMFTHHFYSVSY